jgi:hypothetical protein
MATSATSPEEIPEDLREPEIIPAVGPDMTSMDMENAERLRMIPGMISNSSIDVKDITMSGDLENSSKLPQPDPSRVTLYTIPEGIYLYHGTTTVSQFNPEMINVGKDSLVAFFSPNKELAASYIQNCVAGGEGYIHKFKTLKPIDRIFIFSPNDKDLYWNTTIIESKFCNSSKDRVRLNGIVFAVSDTDKGKFVNSNSTISENMFSCEFALCDPNSSILSYEETSRCVAPRKLSDPYKFTS